MKFNFFKPFKSPFWTRFAKKNADGVSATGRQETRSSRGTSKASREQKKQKKARRITRKKGCGK